MPVTAVRVGLTVLQHALVRVAPVRGLPGLNAHVICCVMTRQQSIDHDGRFIKVVTTVVTTVVLRSQVSALRVPIIACLMFKRFVTKPGLPAVSLDWPIAF